MELAKDELVVLVKFSEGAVVKRFTVIIENFRNGCDLKILLYYVVAFFVNVVEVGLLD